MPKTGYTDAYVYGLYYIILYILYSEMFRFTHYYYYFYNIIVVQRFLFMPFDHTTYYLFDGARQVRCLPRLIMSYTLMIFEYAVINIGAFRTESKPVVVAHPCSCNRWIIILWYINARPHHIRSYAIFRSRVNGLAMPKHTSPYNTMTIIIIIIIQIRHCECRTARRLYGLYYYYKWYVVTI